MLKIRVNGEPRELTKPTTLEDLVGALGVAEGAVAVEVNQSVVTRAEHATTMLNDGDQVEIVTIVGGG